MNSFGKNLTVAQRLGGLILAALLGLIAIAGIAVFQTQKVFTAANYANDNTVPSLLVLQDANEAIGELNTLAWQLLAKSDASGVSELNSKFEASKAKFSKAMKDYEPLISDDKDKKLLESDRSHFETYVDSLGKMMGFITDGKLDEAKEMSATSFTKASQQLSEKIHEHFAYNVQLGKQGEEDAVATQIHARWVMAAVGVVIAVVVSILGSLLIRNLMRQLGAEPGRVQDITRKIADGDLTVHIELQRNDEVSLLYSTKLMRDKLRDIVSEVRKSSDSMAEATEEIARGNLDLSSRTEQQAASIEETAASMEELAGTVTQNAENAQQGNALSQKASENAEKGGEVVAKVVHTMNDINDSSKRIVDIISVIDSIAFQTNILALNAAVEAARAGEQGRGFAVVAAEVRNLAQRSASAAKEIKTLIDESVQKVDTGSKLVNEAGSTMMHLVQSVNQVTAIISDFTQASGEQSSGIAQINQAIALMDESTQQNAALVEEAAAAAGALSDQAKRMVELVGMFKIESDSSQQTAAKLVKQTPLSTMPASKPRQAKLESKPIKSPLLAVKSSGLKPVTAGADDWEQF